jgi:hypothetical protein
MGISLKYLVYSMFLKDASWPCKYLKLSYNTLDH